MDLKTLIILVGLPRSGKSTWAKQQKLPIVNPDSIRLALYGKAFVKEAEHMVWAIAQYMVRALFFAGHDTVILDATNVTKERRSVWKSSNWEIKYKVFDTPKEECIKRAKETDTEYLVPVIESMAEKWEDIEEN